MLKGKGTNYFGTKGQRQPLDRGILITKSIGILALLQEGPLATGSTLLLLPTQQEGWDCVHTFLKSKRPTTAGHLGGYTQQAGPSPKASILSLGGALRQGHFISP